jgi:L-amino acid N-acyltransferase YncA
MKGDFSMPESESITMRIAAPDDAPKLLAIYSYYVKNTAITFEITVPSEAEFRQRIANTLKTYPYIVAVRGDEILGYAYAGPLNTRGAYRFSIETSIYVKSDVRHAGLGRKLYTALEKVLRKQHVLLATACIAFPSSGEKTPYLDTNSHDFHEHLGYTLVGEFHQCAYKFNRWFDMIWMEKPLAEPADPPEEFIPFPQLADPLK